MNSIVRLVAEKWDRVSSRFPEKTRIWAATVLAGDDDLSLNVLANLMDRDQEFLSAAARATENAQARDLAERRAELARKEETRTKEELHEVRSQLTTMSNHILRKVCASNPCGLGVQELFDNYVKRNSDTYDEYLRVKEEYRNHYEKMRRRLEAIARHLGHKGTCEGLDTESLASRVRQEADACGSYKRLATARRTRLCEINAALECEDSQVFQRINDLQGLVGMATECLTDVRNILSIPEGVELAEGSELLVEMMEEILGRHLAIETAIRRECAALGGFTPRGPIDGIRALGLRVANGQKAVDQLVDLGRTKEAALAFYADRNSWATHGTMTERFFAIPAAERDQGFFARIVLGREDAGDIKRLISEPVQMQVPSIPPGKILVLKRRRA